MLKEFFEEGVGCFSLLFHGDVAHIGSHICIIQWNAVTDAVVKLEGHIGLIKNTNILPVLHVLQVIFMVLMSLQRAVLWLVVVGTL